MPTVAVYDQSTGRIVRVVTCSAEVVDQQAKLAGAYNGTWRDAEAALAIETDVDDNVWYVSGGELTARPAMPVSIDVTSIDADGVAEATISNIPAGAEATVRLPGSVPEVTVVDDGALEVSSEVPGTITVDIRAFPYLDWTQEIIAT